MSVLEAAQYVVGGGGVEEEKAATTLTKYKDLLSFDAKVLKESYRLQYAY